MYVCVSFHAHVLVCCYLPLGVRFVMRTMFYRYLMLLRKAKSCIIDQNRFGVQRVKIDFNLCGRNLFGR